ncbi:MAG TPA: hypothetical protein VLH85_07750 [Levilinea sp.]|nr:hypothetical protein [Levilinea sp.]
MALHGTSAPDTVPSTPPAQEEPGISPPILRAGQAGLLPVNSLIPGILRILLVVLLVIAASGIVFSLQPILESWGVVINPDFIDYTVVILLGMLVGFIEIVSRYQDAPFRTALTWPGLFYMLINGLVAGSALWLLRVFGWNLMPETTNADLKRWNEVLIAGLGAMALFRSALFVIGKEEQEISVGPNATLQILLNAIDKEVDRYRGQERVASVRSIMQNVHDEDAISDLTVISGALMQNLKSEDQARISISKLRELIEVASNDDDFRKYLLGLRIIDVAGEDILRQAIGMRGEQHYHRMMEKRIADMGRQA